MGITSSRSSSEDLWDACRRGDEVAVAQTLQNPNIDGFLDWRHPKKGTTPLMVACIGGNRTIVQKLIQAGSNVNSKDSSIHGNTALHYAAYYDRSLVIQLLLESGCDPYKWNTKGHSPIDLARFCGNESSCQIFIQMFAICKAWLYFKKGKQSIVPQWKRKWCVLLPGSENSGYVEIAIYKNPSSCRPNKLIYYHHSLISVVAVPKLKWHDRNHMFAFKEKMRVFKYTSNGFSRDSSISLVRRPKQRFLAFACEDALSVRNWVQALHPSVGTSSILESNHHLNNSSQRFNNSSNQGFNNSSNQGFNNSSNQGFNNSSNQSSYSSNQQSNSPNQRSNSSNQRSNSFNQLFGNSNSLSSTSSNPQFSNNSFPNNNNNTSATTFPNTTTNNNNHNYTMATTFSNNNYHHDQVQVVDDCIEILPVANFSTRRHSNLTTSNFHTTLQENSNPLFSNDDPPPDYNASERFENPLFPNEYIPTAPAIETEVVLSSNCNNGDTSKEDCVVCMDNPRNAVCVPCGHIAACFECLQEISQGCPICRATITTVVRIYNV